MNKVITAVAALKGGALLLSALRYAQEIKLDAAGGTLVLIFAADQLFYRDALEKAHNQSALQAVLKTVLGSDLKIVSQRGKTESSSVAGSARHNPQPRAPLMTAAPVSRATNAPAAGPRVSRQETGSASRAAPTPDELMDEASAEETEVEFDGADELPLRAHPSGDGATASTSHNDDDDAPPAVVARPFLSARSAPPLAKSARPVMQDTADLKAFEAHPLVKSVLKETGGSIVSVSKTKK